MFLRVTWKWAMFQLMVGCSDRLFLFFQLFVLMKREIIWGSLVHDVLFLEEVGLQLQVSELKVSLG